jgi:cellulose 1,4-beta-cellobiosidase
MKRSSQSLLALFGLAATATAQQVCTLNAEGKPTMTWETCTAAGSCTSNSGFLTIDSNWRWTHALSSTTNCYTGNTWNATLCPSNTACASNCCVDGSGGYQSTYGVSSSGSAATLDFITTTQYATNVGSRLYLSASNTEYAMFNLIGKEFTFDVDVSNLPCGLNGALYFVSMDADGGLSKYSGNKAGAQYGTGYCDTQCAMDLKWINGVGNVAGWKPDSNDPNSGVGQLGSCCNEIDIWEANSISNALTLHPCKTTSQHECSGSTCGGTYAPNRYGSDCDPDGCDLNPYRNGATSFYGPGMEVDTTKPFTVVTQFLTDSSGTINNVVRFYVQNGVLYATPDATTITGYTGNSITAGYCTAELSTFGEASPNHFSADGGFPQIQAGWENGMVLVLSLWDDHFANMLWLDSTYPTAGGSPGDVRGSCATSSGVPAQVEANAGNIKVIYSNIKSGAINSTYTYTSVYGGGAGSSSSSSASAPPSSTTGHGQTTTTPAHTTVHTTAAPTTTPPSGGGSTQTHWGQCGGIGYGGPTNCGSYSCSTLNPYYAQCL